MLDQKRQVSHTGMEVENVAKALRGYAVDRLAPQVVKGDNVQYVVRWNGYIPAEDRS